MSRYRFRMIAPGDAPRLITPLNVAALRIQNKREGDNIFFRRKLSGSLTLAGADFAYWLTKENGPNRCQEIRIVIDKLCGGQWIENYWRGVFSSSDCKPDLDGCTVVIATQPDDKYKALLENMGKDWNVLEVTSKTTVTAKLDFDVFFEFRLIDGGKVFDQDDADTWAVFLEIRNWVDGSFPQSGTRENRDIIFRLKRTAAYINGFPADLSREGWKLISTAGTVGTYAKTPDLYNFQPYKYETKADWYNKYPDLQQKDLNEAWDNSIYIEVTGANGAHNDECGQLLNLRYYVDEDRCKRLIWNFASFTFSRNRRLVDVLDYLVNRNDPTARPSAPDAVSLFFTALNNPVTGQVNKLKDVLLAQKTDITGYNSSEPASKGMLSLKTLTDELRKMFRCYWFLDSAGKFRIEHESYFSAQGTFSLLRPQWANAVRNTRKYEYNKTAMPRYQKLTFAEAFNDDFVAGDIEYTSDCVNKQEGQDTVEETVSTFTTDLKGLIIAAGNNKSGFVMLTHAAGKVLDEVGDVTGELIPNGHLSAANLVKTYHRHNRVIIAGKVNGKNTVFASVLKSRKQVKLTVPACCEVINEFARYETTLTDNGALESCDEIMLTGALEFVTLHEAPAGANAGANGARAHTPAFNPSFN
jgi:hypothetical protein